MKKKALLLIIPSLFALSACLFKLPVSGSSATSSKTESSTTSQGGKSSGGSSSQTSSTSKGPIDTSTSISQTAVFDFTETTITTGTNLDVGDGVNKLKNFMNQETNWIRSINQSKCTFQTVPDSTKTILTVGTASSAGTLTLEFNYLVSGIEIEMQGYCKHIQYTGVDAWSSDANAKLDIDGITYNLGSESDQQPEKQDKVIVYPGGASMITFSNFDACERVFIHKLILEFMVY